MEFKITLLALFLFGVASAFPQKTELDLQTAIELAVENNIDLKIKRQEAAFRKLTLDTAWNVLLPTMNINSTLSRQHELPAGSGTGTSTTVGNWNIQAGFSATLNLNAALVHGIAYARGQYESGLLDEDTFRKNLIRDVKKTFYSLLLLEQNVALTRERLETAANRFEKAKLDYETGASSQFDLLTAQVAYENQKPGLKDIENQYQIALLTFKNILGLESTDDIAIVGAIEPDPASFDSNELIARFLPGKPEIRILSSAIESTSIMRRGLALQTYTPSLALSLTFDPAFTGNPFTDSWFGNPEHGWIQRQGMLSVSLSFNLEGLIPGSAAQIRLAELKKEQQELELLREQAVRGATLEIRTLVMNMQKAMENLNSLTLNVELAERAYAIASEGFETGAREFLEVENAEDELGTARLEVLREKYNYMSSLADLEAALYTAEGQAEELRNEK